LGRCASFETPANYGVGVGDWLNCAFYHFFAPTTEFGTFQFTLLATGDHLFENGYTYATVLWDKAVTEIFERTAPNDGQVHNHLVFGSIDRSVDAWEILLDTARLLKNPRVTVTPGTGSSCTSRMRPEIVPVVCCADADPVRLSMTATSNTVVRACMHG
jgi:hypothetical protein